ncbi:fungal-specific transcription factor domain-containing protein [Xylogone sp. PMI_703]|nr:fungal-specific transcription factor domain-containing protein [Xylogone sp. PMI_703]
MQACDLCHRRKSRCDKVRPTCGYCAKAGLICVFTDRSKEPTFRKEHVEALERKLRQAEAKNKALLSDLTRLRTSTTAVAASPGGKGILATPREALEVYNCPDPRTLRSLFGLSLNCVSKDSNILHKASPSFVLSYFGLTSPDQCSESTSPNNDSISSEVINEVSFLASTAAGERYYLGSTSGVLFANLVRASVDVSTPSHLPASPLGVSDTNLRSSARKSINASNVRDTLPSRDLAKELFNHYFAHDHLCYPFLYATETISIVDLIYSDPSYYTKHTFQAFVFDMILAIATANVYKFDWQMLPSAETHHARAMLRANEVFQAGGLPGLQAILLLCQYRTSSSIQDTSASMWHLVGIAVRIAYELGLHREAAYRIKNEEAMDTETMEILRDQEIRRRCFWSILTMDRIVSITLGRPMAIDMAEVDVSLPSVEIDHLTRPPATEPDFPSDLNRTAIFIHIVNYRLLCGKIMRTLHGLKRPEDDEDSMRKRRDTLALELQSWRSKTEDLHLPEMDLSSTMPANWSSFRSKEWYEVLYNNAVLMLFRPSPMLSTISGDSITLHKLFTSSRQAVILYAYLHRSRKINYSWITLHSVFMAGLTYIYALSRHLRERRRGSAASGPILDPDPSAIEIVNDTRACSNVLVAVSERWNTLRGCHEVFDKLSDAVLADAIKLQCNPPRGSQPQTTEQSQSSSPRPAQGQDQTQFQNSAESGNTSANFQQFSGQTPNGVSVASGVQWPRNEGIIPENSQPFYSNPSPLTVDSEFRSCFDHLQHLYNNSPFGNDPVIELSQDWLGYIQDFDGMLTSQASMEMYPS